MTTRKFALRVAAGNSDGSFNSFSQHNDITAHLISETYCGITTKSVQIILRAPVVHTSSTTLRTPFNPAVHGARGLFSLMVFVFHIVNSGLPSFLPNSAPVSFYLLRSFSFGVELFFGISGFVIIGALARAPSLRSFAWDRATRIYPLLWTTLLAITVVSLAVGHWMPPLRDWLLDFLAPPPFFQLAQVNPAAWSLGYEVTFYALCAACWGLRSNGQRSWLPLTVVAGCFGLILFPRAVLMPVGVIIAAGRMTAPWLARLAGAPLLALLLFLIGWRLVDLGSGGNIMTFTPFAMPITAWLRLLPLAVASAACGALALLGIVEQRGLLSQALRTAPLQWLGTVSYSFYLWHPVVLGITKQVLRTSGAVAGAGQASQLLFAAISLPPALIIAHFSQQQIEVRLTRYLRRHGPPEGKGQAPIAALMHTIEPHTP